MYKTQKEFEALIEALETTMLPITNICKQLNISSRQFYRWKNAQTKDVSKAKAIKKALDSRTSCQVDTAEDSLLKKITGYTVEETKEEKFLIEGKWKTVKKVVTRKFIEPETTAIIFLLTNLRPDRWKRNVIDKDTMNTMKEFIIKTSVKADNERTIEIKSKNEDKINEHTESGSNS